MFTKTIIPPTTKGQAICPYCGVGCRLWMESADGELIRVRGVADAPANLGGICAKGATLPEVIHTPDRLMQPHVRPARGSEKMRTLDSVERTIDAGICMIADGDGSRGVGIGGIMGGADTEISFSTRNILIEAAWFEPIAVRRGARNSRREDCPFARMAEGTARSERRREHQ